MDSTRPEITAGPTARNFRAPKVPLDMGSEDSASFPLASLAADSVFSGVFCADFSVEGLSLSGFFLRWVLGVAAPLEGGAAFWADANAKAAKIKRTVNLRIVMFDSSPGMLQ